MKKMWNIWCKTIGSKITDDNTENDIAALLRTVWVLTHLIACFFIIAHNGVKLGWF
tara:strand:+ start:272 stop:439 length:168 start_codon:yes stop_codon:yes gene_type:complete